MGKVDAIARARHKRRVYYPPRFKSILLALVSLAICAASLQALVSSGAERSAVVIYALLGTFVFFGGAAAIIIYRFRKRRPVVIMDANGLSVRLRAGRFEHVDWDAITDVRILPSARMNVLGIAHRRANRHWTDTAAFWRRGDWTVPAPELTIPAASVGAPLKRVAAQIRRRVEL